MIYARLWPTWAGLFSGRPRRAWRVERPVESRSAVGRRFCRFRQRWPQTTKATTATATTTTTIPKAPQCHREVEGPHEPSTTKSSPAHHHHQAHSRVGRLSDHYLVCCCCNVVVVAAASAATTATVAATATAVEHNGQSRRLRRCWPLARGQPN